MRPQDLSIADFLYDLPEERIAYHPLQERDMSQLLVYRQGQISKDIYKNLVQYIPANAFMVFNNTRVVEARLIFQKSTGASIEIFCLNPHEEYRDITTAMQQTARVRWCCLVGGAAKWKDGNPLEKTIIADNKTIHLTASKLERRSDCFVIELQWDDAQMSFAELLHHSGQIPLPPYIKRPPEQADTDRYQTIYAHADGSVAAPTAGLHFTEHLLQRLRDKGIRTENITLHVGAGTFKPVKAAVMQDHEMHAEFIEVSKDFILALQQAKAAPQPVVAVGTTSLRTLESLYWLGCKILQNPSTFKNEIPMLSQWEAYALVLANIPVDKALQALIDYLTAQQADKLIAQTQIIIAPGYCFKIVQGLVTNFHQPASTLLLLVSAFIGEGWKKVYQYALEHEFRFLSYGDGSLLWRE
ncbi:MAG: S-adenosylmethionine:tRNA ribosyltransferase-isomerase [Niabella sp.]